MNTAIRRVFDPAIWLLNRLSFPLKFAFTGTLVALPLLLLVCLFISMLNGNVTVALRELDGSDTIRGLIRIWRTIQTEHYARLKSNRPGEPGERDDPQFRTELQNQLKELTETSSRRREVLNRSARWTTVSNKFKSLLASEDGFQSDVFNPQTLAELIEDIRAVIRQIADLSDQTIDQYLDSQNLAVTSSRLLPDLIEIEDQLRDRLLPTEQSSAAPDRLSQALAESNGAIGILSEQIRRHMLIAMQQNPRLSGRLRGVMVASSESVRKLESSIRARLGEFDDAPSVGDIDELLATANDDSLGLLNATLDGFDQVVKQRVESYRSWRNVLLAMSFLPLMLAAYLKVALCLAIVRTADRMRIVTDQVLSGTGDETTLAVETRDELGRMMEHFRSLAMRIREEWAVARAEAMRASEAEESLRRNQERFDLVLKGANDGIWDWDLQTDRVFYSERFKELLGYDNGEFGVWLSALADVLHADDFDMTWQAVERHLQDRAPYHIEHRLRTKSGEYRWFLERGQAVWNDEGVPIRMAGSIKDITARKGTEARERVRNQVLELLAGGAPLPQVLEPLVTNIESENSGIRCSILLLDKERKRLYTAAAPNLPDWYCEAINGIEIGPEVGSCGTAAYTGKRVIVEDVGTHPYWAKARELALRAGLLSCWSEPIRGNSGIVMGTFAIYGLTAGAPTENDIQLIEVAASLAGIAIERKQLDAALRESEERWKFALEGSGDGVWDWNIRTNDILFSRRWTDMLGFEDNLSVQSWRSRIHPEDRPGVMACLEDYVNGRTANYTREFRVYCHDGTMKWVLSRGIVVSRDPRGVALRMIGTHSDITDRKRMEEDTRRYLQQVEASRDRIADQSIQLIRQSEELGRARDQAEAAARAKSEFLANMSHELRTPLTAILGYADVLYEAASAEQADRQNLETVDIIRSNGRHLQELIDDILDFSKIEANRMTLERVQVPPRKLVEDVLRLMKLRAAEKGLLLQTEFCYPLPDKIVTDALRVRQILVNLVGNAIKFTERGSIKVTLRFDESQQSQLFQVSDTGIGIRPDQLQNLFTPFSQADASMSRRFGGTGLGLSISKRLAQMLGGDITAESRFGTGSTFTLEISAELCPDTVMVTAESASLVPPLGTGTAATTAIPQFTGCRMLLAEDVLANQKLIAFLLQKAGAQVSVVDNGLLAVESIREAAAAGMPFDLVLMDIQMPEMDGYTATRTLRDQGYAGRIIALTAHASEEDRERCLKSGFDGFAVKPIQKEQLFATCRDQLALSQQQVQI